MNKVAFVVATKDRSRDLRKMLRSLVEQKYLPDQVLIVDSSADPVKDVIRDFPRLNIKYLHHTPPSASAQRNVGIGAVDKSIELIGFLDDDIVLAPDALERMLEFWLGAYKDIGGAAFNLMNPPKRSSSSLKESSLTRRLGLYSDRKGAVTPSGWQTLTGTVEKTTYVEWLPSGASVWRREVFEKFRFDEFFQGYSYLEDLDFSYGVSKSYRLAVVADARYWHYPSVSGRVSPYEFGKVEVRNRVYIVRKHGLSLPSCYLGVIIRLLMTLGGGIVRQRRTDLQRAFGNSVGFAELFCRMKGSHNNIK